MVVERTILESIDLVNSMTTSHCDSNLTMKAIRNLTWMLDIFGFEGLIKGFVDFFGLHTVTGEELVGFFGDLDEINRLADFMRGDE